MSTMGALWLMLFVVAAFALAGVWYVRRSQVDLDTHLSARSQTGAWLSMATVVASVAGAWVLFSPAEAATWAGVGGITGYALGQAAPLLALAVIGPRMRALMPDGYSLTDYAWHRFGPAMYGVTLLIVLFYMFVFLAAELTAISLALRLVADVPLGTTALIVAAGTVAYTAYGGIRASIFTDGLQFVLVVPLLVLLAVLALDALGGPTAAFGPVRENAPWLVEFSQRAGIAFGLTLVIAIFAANLFHQGYWQRVYACRDAGTVRRSYLIAAVVTIPVVAVAGAFGLLAIGSGVPLEQGSVALFVLVREVLPMPVLLLLVGLALALVMSSMDTLLNGIASVATSDLARFRPGMRVAGLLRATRWVPAIVVIPAVIVASQGHSVLYLFLLADLVCAAAVFPVFFGLYHDRLDGRGALVSTLAGLAVGAAYFPRPDFSPWLLVAPPDLQFLASFGSALVVSALVAVAWVGVRARLAPGERFDYAILRERVSRIAEPRAHPAPGA
jgi:Na+/proline symporter